MTDKMEREDKGKAILEYKENKQRDVDTVIHMIEGDDSFHILYTIGQASSDYIVVHRAACIPVHDDAYSNKTIRDVFVAVKYVNEVQDPQAFNSLKSKVENSRKIPDHPNILGIRQPFFHRGHYCVVFPYMDVGSIRTIMAKRFPGGLPESCILLALREALIALSAIHERDEVHKEVNAGHIFVSAEPKIKLAFAASIYDLFDDGDQDSSSPFLSRVSICEWAAAPEVYGTNSNNVYRAKSDIWLIGITTLELACGGLRVTSREELDAMLRDIRYRKRLSRRYMVDDLREENRANLLPSCLNLNQSNKSVFSRAFMHMVASCLDMDPEKRPTTVGLLQSGVFDASNYEVFNSNDLFDLVRSDER